MTTWNGSVNKKSTSQFVSVGSGFSTMQYCGLLTQPHYERSGECFRWNGYNPTSHENQEYFVNQSSSNHNGMRERTPFWKLLTSCAVWTAVCSVSEFCKMTCRQLLLWFYSCQCRNLSPAAEVRFLKTIAVDKCKPLKEVRARQRARAVKSRQSPNCLLHR